MAERDKATGHPQPTPQHLPQAVRKEIGEVAVDYYEVTLDGPTGSRRLWCYVPRQEGSQEVPCVLIAPAGSTLCTGMALSETDRPEHTPYLKHGFAVIAFDLSGPTRKGATAEEIDRAIQLYMRADGGLDDGKAALDYALAHLPIDSKRVYVAGHSSAAAFALYFAANEPRIQGVLAYMPPLSARRYPASSLVNQLDGVIPGFARFVDRISPSNCVKDIRCPVFLFRSMQDEIVPLKDLNSLYEIMSRSGATVEYRVSESGDHYEAMIERGIPEGIQWLETVKPARSQAK